MARPDRRKRRIGDSTLGYDDRVGHRDAEFLNPYPWMSATEARVHLELERRGVPFTWRYFDAPQDAPHLVMLMPDYAPEFTLREYRMVIVVQGGYFSTLPGVIDRTALAQTLLEADGWKVVVLWEQDILRDIQGTLTRLAPALKDPPITGKPRIGPYGRPDLMSERRRNLSAFNLLRAYYALSRNVEDNRGRIVDSGRRRRRPRRERARRQRNRARA